jgi:hypothetical protein
MVVQLRGISYAVDHAPDPRRDLAVIRDELHCTTVLLYGAHIGRLRVAAVAARELGLDVWFQPRLQDQPQRKVLEHLEMAARSAEAVRAEHGGVTFVAGCEHSLFTNGLIPGPHTFVRLKLLRFMPRLQPRVTRKLDELLEEATTRARAHFHGPLTYAAAFWEHVDWSRFDVVGVNLYRFAGNAATYTQQLRALADHGKPVVITEFGCCAHAGAEQTGPAGFLIVQWFRSPPRVSPGHVRDEAVQARYLRELLDVYEAEGIAGAFVFTFAMPDFPHRPDDPEHDLDMAGFGVVKVTGDGWEPKAAFHALAARYATQGESSLSSPSTDSRTDVM